MRLATIGPILCACSIALADTAVPPVPPATASAASETAAKASTASANAASEPAGKAAARPLDLTGAAKADAAFRRWVKAWAADTKGALSLWGWAQLDDDAKPERYAVVCGDEDSDEQTLLIEDEPGRRWSIASTMDGRNSCLREDNPKWQRDAPTALALDDAYHGGADMRRVALRHRAPAIVLFESDEHHFHGETECSEDTLDFDRLERHYLTCALNPKDPEGDILTTSDARSALFLIDGDAGHYRQRLGDGDAPDFDVSVRGAGKRLMVDAKLARPARVGEAFEVWTIGSSGRSLAWSARWDGARWQLSGLVRAPRELPPIEGDASRFTLPIVRRHDADAANQDVTPLTLVAISSDGKTRVATSELKAQNPATLGQATTLMSLDAKPQ
jgi:hypothetical protein